MSYHPYQDPSAQRRRDGARIAALMAGAFLVGGALVFGVLSLVSGRLAPPPAEATAGPSGFVPAALPAPGISAAAPPSPYVQGTGAGDPSGLSSLSPGGQTPTGWGVPAASAVGADVGAGRRPPSPAESPAGQRAAGEGIPPSTQLHSQWSAVPPGTSVPGIGAEVADSLATPPTSVAPAPGVFPAGRTAPAGSGAVRARIESLQLVRSGPGDVNCVLRIASAGGAGTGARFAVLYTAFSPGLPDELTALDPKLLTDHGGFGSVQFGVQRPGVVLRSGHKVLGSSIPPEVTLALPPDAADAPAVAVRAQLWMNAGGRWSPLSPLAERRFQGGAG